MAGVGSGELATPLVPAQPAGASPQHLGFRVWSLGFRGSSWDELSGGGGGSATFSFPQ